MFQSHTRDAIHFNNRSIFENLLKIWPVSKKLWPVCNFREIFYISLHSVPLSALVLLQNIVILWSTQLLITFCLQVPHWVSSKKSLLCHLTNHAISHTFTVRAVHHISQKSQGQNMKVLSLWSERGVTWDKTCVSHQFLRLSSTSSILFSFHCGLYSNRLLNHTHRSSAHITADEMHADGIKCNIFGLLYDLLPMIRSFL